MYLTRNYGDDWRVFNCWNVPVEVAAAETDSVQMFWAELQVVAQF